MLTCFSHVRLFATLWTVAHQAPLSMGILQARTGAGCHAFLQGIFPTRDRIRDSCLLRCQVGSSPLAPLGKPHLYVKMKNILQEHIYKLFPPAIMTRSAVLASVHWACPECPVHFRVLSTRLRTFLCIISYHLLHIPLRCESEVAQSCPALCDPMDYSLSGSSIHGIFQARVLERIAISFSRGSSRPRNRTRVSRIASRALLSEPPGKTSEVCIPVPFYR